MAPILTFNEIHLWTPGSPSCSAIMVAMRFAYHFSYCFSKQSKPSYPINLWKHIWALPINTRGHWCVIFSAWRWWKLWVKQFFTPFFHNKQPELILDKYSKSLLWNTLCFVSFGFLFFVCARASYLIWNVKTIKTVFLLRCHKGPQWSYFKLRLKTFLRGYYRYYILVVEFCNFNSRRSYWCCARSGRSSCSQTDVI